MVNQNKSSIFIVTGMHRSGTSLTASLMQSAGVHIGERLMGASPANPKGHFENLDFVGFHENALHSQGLSPEGWTIQKSIQTPQELLEQAKLIIAENERYDYWGWKDPRTTLFLDFWKNLLPQAYFIFTYRSPWEVIDSLYRRGDPIFYNNPQYALQIWMHYNQIILEFYRQFPEQSILLNTDNIIIDHTVISKLCERKFCIKLKEPSQEILDTSLMKKIASDSPRQMLIKKFFPEAVELYNALNNQADLKFQPVHLDTWETDQSFRSFILQDWLDVYKISNQYKTELGSSQSQLQQTQAELESSRSQLQQTQAELEQSQSQLQQTQAELEQSQSQLQQTQVELGGSQSQLQQTQAQLESLRSQLQQTQAESEQSRSQFQFTQMKLEQLQSQFQQMEMELKSGQLEPHDTQLELQQLRTRLTAMESSKFWRLRKVWLQVKSALGLKVEE